MATTSFDFSQDDGQPGTTELVRLTRRIRIVIASGALMCSLMAATRSASGQFTRPNPRGPTSGPDAKRPGVNVVRDVEYARIGDKCLLLDIYAPAGPKGKLPVVVWIHGGCWAFGSKQDLPWGNGIGVLVPRGYAVACINYRFAQDAVFPAQIEDCKAAVRFLRATATKYSLDPDRVGVWGSSAGGHLAALLGTSGDAKEFEGKVGGNLEFSSRVQCVVDYFGPTDFAKFNDEKTRAKMDNPNWPMCKLVGGLVKDKRELVAKANPISYITKNTPPFLVGHGDEDAAVSFYQSELLVDALKKAGVGVTFEVVKGHGHDFIPASDPTPAETHRNRLTLVVADFLDTHLKPVRKAAPASQPMGGQPAEKAAN